MLKRNLWLVCVLACVAFLVACGEESSALDAKEPLESAKENVDDGASEGYASLDDLHACMNKFEGELATVQGSLYLCSKKRWQKIEGRVKGVCNLHACDKKSEGERLYATVEKKLFQCKSGSWLDLEGKTFSEQEYISCFVDALVQDSVKTLDDLKACSAQREGQLSVVASDLVACTSRKWVELSGHVVSEADLPNCSKRSFIYVLVKKAVYTCKDGAWYTGETKVKDSVLSSASTSSSAGSL